MGWKKRKKKRKKESQKYKRFFFFDLHSLFFWQKTNKQFFFWIDERQEQLYTYITLLAYRFLGTATEALRQSVNICCLLFFRPAEGRKKKARVQASHFYFAVAWS